MELAQAIYRLATDAGFANRMQREPDVALETAGFRLTNEERAAVLAVLSEGARWRALCSVSAAPREQFEWHALSST